MEAVAIIPARWAASRFPGKVLATLAGRPLIQHVYERVRRAQKLTEVVVATDDERILSRVEKFGGKAILTSRTHPSGTDRVAEAAREYFAPIIINVQGDEPLINPTMIDSLVDCLAAAPDIVMASLMHRLDNAEDYSDPDVVKVVVDRDSFALYFSRSPIPNLARTPSAGTSRNFPVHKHIGVYGFQRDFLFGFTRLPRGMLEQSEKLEQLRALENGYKIKMVATEFDTLGVDTPEDLAEVERRLKLETG